jgi:hypothetical protein
MNHFNALSSLINSLPSTLNTLKEDDSLLLNTLLDIKDNLMTISDLEHFFIPLLNHSNISLIPKIYENTMINSKSLSNIENFVNLGLENINHNVIKLIEQFPSFPLLINEKFDNLKRLVKFH